MTKAEMTKAEMTEGEMTEWEMTEGGDDGGARQSRHNGVRGGGVNRAVRLPRLSLPVIGQSAWPPCGHPESGAAG